MDKCNVGADAPSPPAYLVARLRAYLEKKAIYVLSLTCYCLYYVVFGLVLARPYPNKLISFQACVFNIVVEWRPNQTFSLQISGIGSKWPAYACYLQACPANIGYHGCLITVVMS